MAAMPEQIGDYKVVRELGRGAMGVVYLAVHPSLGRQMALKVMARELAGDPEFLERFRREGEAAARLRHPNIVQVFDFAHRDGLYFIAMEYLGDKTLKDLLQDDGEQSVETSCRMLDELLSALALAHTKGIVHRDIKPANVMLTDDGPIALTDFSIARMKESSKLTQTGAIVGTPEYMAPEQFDGTWDARSDLYAAGIVFYELLTGLSPFRSATMTEVMRKQLLTVPDPPAMVNSRVPVAISQVVSRALEKDPEARPQSADEMREAIRSALRDIAGEQPAGPVPGAVVAQPSDAAAAKTLPGAPEALVPARPVASPREASAPVAPPAPLREPPKAAQSEASPAPLPILPEVGAQKRLAPPVVQAEAPASLESSKARQRVGLALIAAGLLLAVVLYYADSAREPATPVPPEASPSGLLSSSPVPTPAYSPPAPPPEPIAPPKPEPPVSKFPSKAYIAPGIGVGDIGLGMGKAKVRNLWGEPSEGISKNGLSQWLYGGKSPAGKCLVAFNKKNVVEAIAVTTPDFVISGDPNCRVGATYQTVKATYRNPTLDTGQGLDYRDQGLLFLFQNNRCMYLVVYGRGRDVTTLQFMK